MESHSTICINNLKIFRSSDSVIHFLEHILKEINLFSHSTNIELTAYYVLDIEDIDLISVLVEIRRDK